MAQSATDRERMIVEAVMQLLRCHNTAAEQLTKFAQICTTLLEEATRPEPRPQEPSSLTTLRHTMEFVAAQRKRREAADNVDEATRRQAADRDEQMQQRLQRLQETYTEMQVKDSNQHVKNQTENTKM
jgi:hypothetical protein